MGAVNLLGMQGQFPKSLLSFILLSLYSGCHARQPKLINPHAYYTCFYPNSPFHGGFANSFPLQSVPPRPFLPYHQGLNYCVKDTNRTAFHHEVLYPLSYTLGCYHHFVAYDKARLLFYPFVEGQIPNCPAMSDTDAVSSLLAAFRLDATVRLQASAFLQTLKPVIGEFIPLEPGKEHITAYVTAVHHGFSAHLCGSGASTAALCQCQPKLVLKQVKETSSTVELTTEVGTKLRVRLQGTLARASTSLSPGQVVMALNVPRSDLHRGQTVIFDGPASSTSPALIAEMAGDSPFDQNKFWEVCRGIGMLTELAELQGWSNVLGVENDFDVIEDACELDNSACHVVVHCDVSNPTWTLVAAESDLGVGGPPCQPYKRIGKRGAGWNEDRAHRVWKGIILGCYLTKIRLGYFEEIRWFAYESGDIEAESLIESRALAAKLGLHIQVVKLWEPPISAEVRPRIGIAIVPQALAGSFANWESALKFLPDFHLGVQSFNLPHSISDDLLTLGTEVLELYKSKTPWQGYKRCATYGKTATVLASYGTAHLSFGDVLHGHWTVSSQTDGPRFWAPHELAAIKAMSREKQEKIRSLTMPNNGPMNTEKTLRWWRRLGNAMVMVPEAAKLTTAMRLAGLTVARPRDEFLHYVVCRALPDEPPTHALSLTATLPFNVWVQPIAQEAAAQMSATQSCLPTQLYAASADGSIMFSDPALANLQGETGTYSFAMLTTADADHILSQPLFGLDNPDRNETRVNPPTFRQHDADDEIAYVCFTLSNQHGQFVHYASTEDCLIEYTNASKLIGVNSGRHINTDLTIGEACIRDYDHYKEDEGPVVLPSEIREVFFSFPWSCVDDGYISSQMQKLPAPIHSTTKMLKLLLVEKFPFLENPDTFWLESQSKIMPTYACMRQMGIGPCQCIKVMPRTRGGADSTMEPSSEPGSLPSATSAFAIARRGLDVLNQRLALTRLSTWLRVQYGDNSLDYVAEHHMLPLHRADEIASLEPEFGVNIVPVVTFDLGATIRDGRQRLRTIQLYIPLSAPSGIVHLLASVCLLIPIAELELHFAGMPRLFPADIRDAIGFDSANAVTVEIRSNSYQLAHLPLEDDTESEDDGGTNVHRREVLFAALRSAAASELSRAAAPNMQNYCDPHPIFWQMAISFSCDRATAARIASYVTNITRSLKLVKACNHKSRQEVALRSREAPFDSDDFSSEWFRGIIDDLVRNTDDNPPRDMLLPTVHVDLPRDMEADIDGLFRDATVTDLLNLLILKNLVEFATEPTFWNAGRQLPNYEALSNLVPIEDAIDIEVRHSDPHAPRVTTAFLRDNPVARVAPAGIEHISVIAQPGLRTAWQWCSDNGGTVQFWQDGPADVTFTLKGDFLDPWRIRIQGIPQIGVHPAAVFDISMPFESPEAFLHAAVAIASSTPVGTFTLVHDDSQQVFTGLYTAAFRDLLLEEGYTHFTQQEGNTNLMAAVERYNIANPADTASANPYSAARTDSQRLAPYQRLLRNPILPPTDRNSTTNYHATGNARDEQRGSDQPAFPAGGRDEADIFFYFQQTCVEDGQLPTRMRAGTVNLQSSVLETKQELIVTYPFLGKVEDFRLEHSGKSMALHAKLGQLGITSGQCIHVIPRGRGGSAHNGPTQGTWESSPAEKGSALAGEEELQKPELFDASICTTLVPDRINKHSSGVACVKYQTAEHLKDLRTDAPCALVLRGYHQYRLQNKSHIPANRIFQCTARIIDGRSKSQNVRPITVVNLANDNSDFFTPRDDSMSIQVASHEVAELVIDIHVNSARKEDWRAIAGKQQLKDFIIDLLGSYVSAQLFTVFPPFASEELTLAKCQVPADKKFILYQQSGAHSVSIKLHRDHFSAEETGIEVFRWHDQTQTLVQAHAEWSLFEGALGVFGSRTGTMARVMDVHLGKSRRELFANDPRFSETNINTKCTHLISVQGFKNCITMPQSITVMADGGVHAVPQRIVKYRDLATVYMYVQELPAVDKLYTSIGVLLIQQVIKPNGPKGKANVKVNTGPEPKAPKKEPPRQPSAGNPAASQPRPSAWHRNSDAQQTALTGPAAAPAASKDNDKDGERIAILEKQMKTVQIDVSDLKTSAAETTTKLDDMAKSQATGFSKLMEMMGTMNVAASSSAVTDDRQNKFHKGGSKGGGAGGACFLYLLTNLQHASFRYGNSIPISEIQLAADFFGPLGNFSKDLPVSVGAFPGLTCSYFVESWFSIDDRSTYALWALETNAQNRTAPERISLGENAGRSDSRVPDFTIISSLSIIGNFATGHLGPFLQRHFLNALFYSGLLILISTWCAVLPRNVYPCQDFLVKLPFYIIFFCLRFCGCYKSTKPPSSKGVYHSKPARPYRGGPLRKRTRIKLKQQCAMWGFIRTVLLLLVIISGHISQVRDNIRSECYFLSLSQASHPHEVDPQRTPHTVLPSLFTTYHRGFWSALCTGLWGGPHHEEGSEVAYVPSDPEYRYHNRSCDDSVFVLQDCWYSCTRTLPPSPFNFNLSLGFPGEGPPKNTSPPEANNFYNPKCVHLVGLNVSSAEANLGGLTSLATAVGGIKPAQICVQETRIHREAHTVQAALNSVGCNMFLGQQPPITKVGGAAKNFSRMPPGGTGIITQSQTPIRPCNIEAPFQYLAAHLSVAWAPTSTGKHGYILGSLYLPAGKQASQKREEIMRDVFEYLSIYSRVPTFLFADLQDEPCNIQSVYHSLFTTEWFDLVAHFDRVLDRETVATFSKCNNSGAVGTYGNTRIDAVLCNSAALSLVSNAFVEKAVPFRNHAALIVELNVERFQDSFLYQNKGSSWPSLAHRAFPKELEWEPLNTSAKTLLKDFLPSFEEALKELDQEKMWHIACEVAHAYLDNLTGESIPELRGELPSFNREIPTSTCPASCDSNVFGDEFQKLSQHLSHLYELKQKFLVLRKHNNEPPSPTWLLQFNNLKVKVMNNSAASPQLDAMLAPTTVNDVERAIAQCNDALTKFKHEVFNRAIANWKRKLRESSRNNRREVHRWLKGANTGAPRTFIKPDGTPTSCTAEMHAMLQCTWEAIYGHHDPNTFQAMLQQFRDKYRTILDTLRDPIQFEPLRGDDLFKVIKDRPADKAAGADCWLTREVKFLPPAILDLFAMICNVAELTGEWPAVLKILPVVIIDKGEGVCTPSAVRCIGLNSVIYSTWSSCRFRASQDWQSRNFPPELTGGIAARMAADSELTLSSHIEGMEDDDPLVAIFLDRWKAFDMLIPEVVFPILQELGFDQGVVRALLGYYRDQKRFFRLGNKAGPWLNIVHSAVQGCSMSILVTNAIYTVWRAHLVSEGVDIHTSTFIDDCKFWTKSSQTLQLSQAYQLTSEFDADIGQVQNSAKSTVAAPTKKLAAFIAGQTDDSLKQAKCTRSLGYSQNFANAPAAKLQQARVKKAMCALKKMAFLPTNAYSKELHICANGHSKWLYGSEIRAPSNTVFRDLRSAVVKVLWRSKKPMRIPILVTLLADRWEVDPEFAWMWHVFSTIRRVRARDRALYDVILKRAAACQPQRSQTKQGVAATLAYACFKLGWVLDAHDLGKVQRPNDTALWLGQGSKAAFKRELHRSFVAYSVKGINQRHDWTPLGDGEILDLESSKMLFRGGKTLEGPEIVDSLTRLGPLTPYKLTVLRSALTGSVYNGERLFAAGFRDTNSCPFCTKTETFDHLFRECSAYHECRSSATSDGTIQRVRDVMGLGIFPSQLNAHRERIACKISPPPQPPAKEKLDGDFVYCDGACFEQDNENARRAAGAATTLHGDPISLELPGFDHTSPRSEIWALIIALTHFEGRFTIASDCAYVVQTTQWILESRGACLTSVDNLDLWEIAAPLLLACHQLSIIKVKGHATAAQVSDNDNLKMFKEGNDKVDAAAKSAVNPEWQEIRDLMKQHQADVVMRQTSIIKTLVHRTAFEPVATDLHVCPELKVENAFPPGLSLQRTCDCRPVTRLWGKQCRRCRGECKFTFEMGVSEEVVFSSAKQGLNPPAKHFELLKNRYAQFFMQLRSHQPRCREIKLNAQCSPLPRNAARDVKCHDNFGPADANNLLHFVNRFSWSRPSPHAKACITYYELFVYYVHLYGWPNHWIPRASTLSIILRRFTKHFSNTIQGNPQVRVVKNIRTLKQFRIGVLSGINIRPYLEQELEILPFYALLHRLLSVINIGNGVVPIRGGLDWRPGISNELSFIFPQVPGVQNN